MDLYKTYLGIQADLEPAGLFIILGDMATVVGTRMGEEREDWKEGATTSCANAHSIYAQETEATLNQGCRDLLFRTAYQVDYVVAPLRVVFVSSSLVGMIHQ